MAQYLPIEDIRNGIIYTRDHRYVKIIEVTPINLLLRSAREQRNIIYSFISYLKFSPAKIQFKVLTKKADVNRHLYKIEEEIAHETDERCRVLQQDYANLVRQLGSKEAITRRFFLIFEYEGIGGRRGDEKEAIAELQSTAQTAAIYLRQCGNEVIQYENDSDFTPESAISRQQFSSVLYLYAQFKGYDVSVGEETNILSYDDAFDISEYAIPAMQYVIGAGIVNGKTPSTVNPKDNATRAEIAMILYRFIEKVK